MVRRQNDRALSRPDAIGLDRDTKRVAVVVVLGLVMSILDMTIVNVALNSLSHDLHSSLDNIQWVVSAYLLALAAVIPISGWTVRRFGAYRIYVYALILFTAGSVLCGLARTSGTLIAFRAVQGVGGGLLGPTGMTLLVKAVGKDKLARVMSAIGVPMVIAPVFGPTLGGLLLQSVGWQAIFFVNLPIGVVTLVAAARMLPRDRPEPGGAGRLDVLALFLGAAGTVGLTYGLSQSATAGTFTSATVIVPVVAGVALVAGFVVRSRRSTAPLLDLGLYRNRVFSAATTVMFVLGAVLFSTMILLPLYFQDVRGDSALATGLLLVPGGLGAAVGMNRSASASNRFGAGITSLLGVIALLVGTVPFLFVTAGTGYALILVASVVRGFGSAFATMPAMTVAFTALEEDQVGDASPQLNVIQRVGGSLGTAVIAVVLQDNLSGSGGRLGAMAAGFDRTYGLVIALSVLSCLPTVVLWRYERSAGLRPDRLTVPEDSMIEVIA